MQPIIIFCFVMITLSLWIQYIGNVAAEDSWTCCQPGHECNVTTIRYQVCNITGMELCCDEGWMPVCVETAIRNTNQCSIVCGNGFCQKGQTCQNCPQDCGPCNKQCNVYNSTVFDSDPLFQEQWHLLNARQEYRSPDGLVVKKATVTNDIQVTTVWSSGHTGVMKYNDTQIVVAVVDDGVDPLHEDIFCAYDEHLSEDLDRGTKAQSAQYWDAHGTSCAGLIVARPGNGKCGNGVAYNAKLSALRILGENFSDALAAEALTRYLDKVDIYSNSWGPSDNGKVLKTYPLSRAAVHDGALLGRNGKGSIYVWAGGNGRLNGDNSNYDGLANSIYTISVAASDWNGFYSAYSEAGANVLITAPSSTYFINQSVTPPKYYRYSAIRTTDRRGYAGYDSVPSSYNKEDNDCTGTFGGTSAATPIASGVIALMLAANPQLTWRDVQWALVETSNKNIGNANGWVKNGAGKKFNPDYGFGRIDASKAIDYVTSEKWKHVCTDHLALPLIPTFGSSPFINIPISQNVSSPTILSFNTSHDFIVEHAVLTVDIQHSHRGNIIIFLVSPSGTLSKLAPGRPLDSHANIEQFPFMSVQFWGERSNASSTWQAVIVDASDAPILQGSLRYLSLSLYGSTPNCESLSPIPEPVNPEPHKPSSSIVDQIKVIVLISVFGLCIFSIIFTVMIEIARFQIQASREVDLDILREMIDRDDLSEAGIWDVDIDETSSSDENTITSNGSASEDIDL